MLAKFGIGLGIVIIVLAAIFIGGLLGGLLWWLVLAKLIGLSITYWQCVGVSIGLWLVGSAFRSAV